MIKEIFHHRSVRAYKNKPIPEEVLLKILEAGTRASNTGNMQAYSIIVSKDNEIRKKLWESHFKQEMVLQAPVHITFCADLNRFTKWCKLRNTEPGYNNFLWFMNSAIDALLASQNIVLEAEAHGLGACYLGTATYNADKIINILDLPELVVPVAAIVLGYPDQKPPLTERLPMESVIHMENYQDFNPEFIDKIYKERESSEETRELLTINQKKNLAEIFTENRYKKSDNIFFSEKYLEVIKKQGFLSSDS